jgi:hypothetical protein
VSPSEILEQVGALGARLEARGDVVRIYPPNVIPPDLKEAIRQNKPAIMALLLAGTPQAPPDPDLEKRLEAAIVWLGQEFDRGNKDSDALIKSAKSKGWSDRLLRLAAGRLKLVSRPYPGDAPSSTRRFFDTLPMAATPPKKEDAPPAEEMPQPPTVVEGPIVTTPMPDAVDPEGPEGVPEDPDKSPERPLKPGCEVLREALPGQAAEDWEPWWLEKTK